MKNLNKTTPPWFNFILSMALFLGIIIAYQYFAHERHIINPADKLFPTFDQMVKGFQRFAIQPDKNGEYRLWVDTAASGIRILISMGFIFFGVIIGIHMGLFPTIEALLYKFTIFFDKVPALALLPILFISFGLGEVSKIALIVLGVVPTIILDTYIRVKAFPEEQLVKALTLQASKSQIVYKIVLPKIFPLALDAIRLNFKAVILFLISGEALAATEGLGYRIFVVRRYLAMDVIIPYVIWIGLLAFAIDSLIRFWLKKKFYWVNK